MSEKNMVPIIVSLLGVFFGVFSIMQAMTSGTSAVSTSVKFVGVSLALVCLVRPRAGLYIISLEAFTVDYVKKIAVYYGSASTQTIIEAMVIVMLAVVATILGMLMNSVFGKANKMNRLAWLIFFGGLLWSAGIVASGLDGRSFIGIMQNAFNSGAYFALAAVILTYLVDRDSIFKLLDFQLLLAIASAIWAFKQVLIGWNDLELFYVDSWLSPVSSSQYYSEILIGGEPRPTGLASGSKNLGFFAGYFVYAFYRAFILRKHWIRYVIAAAIMGAALIVSRQKAPLVIGAVAPALAFVFRSRLLTVGVYAVGAASFIAIVLNSDALRADMRDIDESIRSSVGVSTAFNLRTFSARLDSYRILKDPKNWSMFGLSEERVQALRAHDILTSLLLHGGAVTLLSILTLLSTLVFIIHRAGWKIRDPVYRKMFCAFLAYIMAALAANVTGGSNLHTLPINLTIWSFMGCLLVAYTRDRQNQVRIKQSLKVSTSKVASDFSTPFHPA